MKYPFIAAALLLTAAAPPPSAGDIERDAPASAWRSIAPENLLLVETARGNVAIELAPDFAPVHIAAIRAFARAGRFDGGAIIRVQDNYVVQFAVKGSTEILSGSAAPAGAPVLPAEYERSAARREFTPLPYRDAYARAGFSGGWPVAEGEGKQWLTHCYGMVGVGRNLPPDTGDGSELYAVIGHAPRHLDRNIALVGRVVEGFSNWTALPRGTEALGVYKTEAEHVPVRRAVIAADLPPAERPRFEVMQTASPSFRALIAARANRREDFFTRPAGGVDLCNVRIPVRRVP